MAQRKYITKEMIEAILEMHDARPELTNIQLAKCFAVSNGTVGNILNGQHPLQIDKSKQEVRTSFDNTALVNALRDINETLQSMDSYLPLIVSTLRDINETLQSMDSSLLLIADALFKDETESDKEDEHESA